MLILLNNLSSVLMLNFFMLTDSYKSQNQNGTHGMCLILPIRSSEAQFDQMIVQIFLDI